ncbi:hypothetical protein KTAU_16320 [Thermogemmatispora aurantia]|uniref:Uncharacterized protein n=1 Tax=Thermogemmatispora aurantia TaxID=2045279 RepID=A0A5J4K632_9CHLR|nr:hypothetical protein KTAU_16320 [Thermogemmatispora aurantia]
MVGAAAGLSVLSAPYPLYLPHYLKLSRSTGEEKQSDRLSGSDPVGPRRNQSVASLKTIAEKEAWGQGLTGSPMPHPPAVAVAACEGANGRFAM